MMKSDHPRMLDVLIGGWSISYSVQSLLPVKIVVGHKFVEIAGGYNVIIRGMSQTSFYSPFHTYLQLHEVWSLILKVNKLENSSLSGRFEASSAGKGLTVIGISNTCFNVYSLSDGITTRIKFPSVFIS